MCQLDAHYNPGLSKEGMKAALQRERERRRKKKSKKKSKIESHSQSADHEDS